MGSLGSKNRQFFGDTQQEHLVSEFAVHQVKFMHKPSQGNPYSEVLCL